MAGYSGTPLPQKLGIKPGTALCVIGAPTGFARALGELPPGAAIASRAEPPLAFVLLFARSRAVLAQRFAEQAAGLAPDGMLWVAWPKKAAKVDTDLDENAVREVGLAAGLVDNKVCAIDATWSGLRFVVRLADRASRGRPRKGVSLPKR